MRYGEIDKIECVNGSGWGVSVFSAGCPFRCPGCHNKELWPLSSGKEWTKTQEDEVVELVQKPYISRLSILGGEPLIEPNCDALLSLFERVRWVRPDIKIWLYTGYTFKFLMENALDVPEKIYNVIFEVDYLVDGFYKKELKDLTLAFRGSSNQNIFYFHDKRIENVSKKFDFSGQSDII